MGIDRNWFITVATYGTWLPGDERGFVGYHRPNSRNDQRLIHNVVGTTQDADAQSLRRYATSVMTGDPVLLTQPQALALLEQFLETAEFRGWRLWAVAIMANHFHVVVGVPGDPDPITIRRDLKSWGSRRLNRDWRKPKSGSWWVERGSKRKLPTDDARNRAIRYTIDQEFPLVVWTHPIPELDLAGGFIHPREPGAGEPGA